MLKITEILPNPTGKDSKNEWIELTNFTDQTTEQTPITQTITVDDSDGGSKPFTKTITFHPNTPIVLKSSETKINLNNTTDTTRIFDKNGALLDELKYSSPKEGQSLSLVKIKSAAKEHTAATTTTTIWTTPSPGEPNKTLYKFEGITETTGTAINQDQQSFTLTETSSQKPIKIMIDPTSQTTFTANFIKTGTPLKILAEKIDNQTFRLVDYKITQTQNSQNTIITPPQSKESTLSDTIQTTLGVLFVLTFLAILTISKLKKQKKQPKLRTWK